MSFGCQRMVGQNGTLDQAGVIDRGVDLAVCLRHRLIGFFKRLRAARYLVFQLFGIAADFFGHDYEGMAQIAQLVVARWRQGDIEAPLGDGQGRLLERAQRVQDQRFDGVTKSHQQDDDPPGDDRDGHVQPTLVDDLCRLQVDGGDDVPLEFR